MLCQSLMSTFVELFQLVSLTMFVEKSNFFLLSLRLILKFQIKIKKCEILGLLDQGSELSFKILGKNDFDFHRQLSYLLQFLKHLRMNFLVWYISKYQKHTISIPLHEVLMKPSRKYLSPQIATISALLGYASLHFYSTVLQFNKSSVIYWAFGPVISLHQYLPNFLFLPACLISFCHIFLWCPVENVNNAFTIFMFMIFRREKGHFLKDVHQYCALLSASFGNLKITQ